MDGQSECIGVLLEVTPCRNTSLQVGEPPLLPGNISHIPHSGHSPAAEPEGQPASGQTLRYLGNTVLKHFEYHPWVYTIKIYS